MGGYGEGRLERAWPRAITGPCQPRHYPQLSVCVLRLGFSGPLRASEARESHREASRPKRPRKPPEETGDKEGEGEGRRRRRRRRGESRLRVYIGRSIIWRLASSDADRSGTFRFSALYASSSRAARPQGMRPIRREGLMHGYFHDRRSDTAGAITVEEEGRDEVMRVGSGTPLEISIFTINRSCCSSYFWIGFRIFSL